MKLGIIGYPLSGRSTVFTALTGARGEDSFKSHLKQDQRIGTVMVADERVDFLSAMYRPKKTTYAKVEYLLPSDSILNATKVTDSAMWNQARICDALIHVVRNFIDAGGSAPSCEKDFWNLEEEMILSDLVVAEKRVERIELDRKRGKKPGDEEHELIKSCVGILENNEPLRLYPEIASDPLLKGFTFLSAKPQLVVCNNEDEDESMPQWERVPQGLERLVIRARLEMDLSAMSTEEAREFFAEYNIETSALDRVIKSSYEALNRISFFTVGDDEVKAWTIEKDTPALEAAGVIHTDIQKGFIRAEVLSYDDLIRHGGFKEAKNAGQVRLEGKGYKVRDGDIINFRFNI